MRKDSSTRKYANGKKQDMVEEDLEYLRRSEEAYLGLVERFGHWERVVCVDEEGRLRSKEEIQEGVKKVLLKQGIF